MVLYLYEPLYGLDYTACYDIVKILKKISDKGITIICTMTNPKKRLVEIFD